MGGFQLKKTRSQQYSGRTLTPNVRTVQYSSRHCIMNGCSGHGSRVGESGQHEELWCLQPSSLTFNSKPWHYFFTFFVFDGGKNMCLDNLRRKIEVTLHSFAE